MKRDKYVGMDVHEWIDCFNERRLLETSGVPAGAEAACRRRGEHAEMTS